MPPISGRAPIPPSRAAGASLPRVAQPEATIELCVPASIDEATSAQAALAAANKLIDVVTQHKDRDGSKGLDGYGKGDPRVTARRSALTTLIAAKTGGFVDEAKLKAISAEVGKDIEFLKTTEHRDYTLEGRDQFDWYKPFDNHTVSASVIQSEFDARVKAQKSAAESFVSGQTKFMDVSSMSLVGIGLIPDGRKRSDAMMDALLQFRARTDAAKQTENAWTTRIDRFGIALLAEQRVLLSSLKLDAADGQSQRDFALLRELISSHPINSMNGIYEARNAVSSILTDQGRSADRMSSSNSPTNWIWKEVPPGGTASPYSTIHHNFSRDTPRNIRLLVEEWMLPVGPRVQRAPIFAALVSAMTAARKGDLSLATSTLAPWTLKLMHGSGPQLVAFADKISAAMAEHDGPKLADLLCSGLKELCVKNLGINVEGNLEMANRLYASVCAGQPSAETLEADLFLAGSAFPAVADVIAAIRSTSQSGSTRSTLMELGEARLAMRAAIFDTPSGHARHEMIGVDAQLLRLGNEYLGATVDKIGTLKTDADKADCLIALQSALRSAIASGLPAIVSDKDRAAAPRGALEDARKLVDTALSKGTITETEYRQAMSSAHVAVRETVQNIRSYADERAAEVALGGVQIDPEFIDQFIKQSPLHYATALTEKGMRVGLHEKITARSVENVEGMRILNGIGPVVFSNVVFAENGKELATVGASKDQLAVLYHLEEKKMIAVGGMFVDTAQAPGGNSHLNMYAMNNGIPVVALPELRTKYAEFFKTAQEEGGIYVDDSGDGFKMMTVKLAQEQGLVGTTKAELDKLRPGMNRKITFLKPTTAGDAFEIVAKHDAIINATRGTRTVEIYVPQDEVRGIGRGVPTFDELATLGLHARHLAGEKGTVLALLSQHPKLGKHTPKGSEITPGDIRDLLRGAVMKDGQNLLAAWDAVWSADPKVGVVDDRNFLQSAFYTDAAYRQQTREALVAGTREALTASLLEGTKLSPAGAALYQRIMRNPALANAKNGQIIFRSSFTGEDRPGKSGAGQYESYVDRKVANGLHGKDVVTAQFDKLMAALATKDDATIALARAEHDAFMGPARVLAAIGVVESTWMAEPIENNAAEQFFLKHIGPTCVVQACIDPDISGVMISRDLESGARNRVTFQLVKGFGGGVDGGKATEGVISHSGSRVTMTDGQPTPGAKVTVGGIEVSEADMAVLRTLVLETEKFFHETIEPGKGYAVDMEVARQDGEWFIVQARVILTDK
jgi:hypothetical protein